jgi:hypothetical protein
VVALVDRRGASALAAERETVVSHYFKKVGSMALKETELCSQFAADNHVRASPSLLVHL